MGTHPPALPISRTSEPSVWNITFLRQCFLNTVISWAAVQWSPLLPSPGSTGDPQAPAPRILGRRQNRDQVQGKTEECPLL